MPNKILLVIDPQMAYAEGGALPVVGFEESIDRICAAIDGWDGPIYVFQHDLPNSPFQIGSDGFKLHPKIRDRMAKFADVVIKILPSAFPGWGGDPGIFSSEIYICGYMANHCVLATFFDAVRASRLPPVILSDAIGSPVLDGLSAHVLVDAALVSATAVYGRACTVEEAIA